MNTRALLFLLAAMSFGSASSSFAQGSDAQGVDERCNYQRGPVGNAPHCYPDANYGARGPAWERGARVIPQFRSNQYVVEDWRAHGLSRPPRGQQWVQVGGDYVLVDRRTGRVAETWRGR
jgi:Ni/Co efflux regulator RcnB